MENFNKTWPFITAVVGFGILIFSIFSFMVGMRTELKADVRQVRTELKTDIREIKTELNARIDRVEARMGGIEGKLDQLILLQAQSMSHPKPIRTLPNKKTKRKPAQAQ